MKTTPFEMVFIIRVVMIDKLKLREFEDNDIELFKKWVYEDYIAKWYHDPLSWIHEIESRHDEFHWINHYIVTYNGEDIGFCQYYAYENSEEVWHGTIELKGTYSIDYLIGDRDYLSRGLGRDIIKLLTRTIFALPDAKRIIVQPEEENKASCNTLLSAGFVFDCVNELYLIER